MPRPLAEVAETWRSEEDTETSADQELLVRYLLDNAYSPATAITLPNLCQRVAFSREYSEKQLQQLVIGPLRRSGVVFVGMCNKGMYLVTDAEGAEKSIGFYTGRIHSEQYHLRHLKAISRRHRLFASRQTSVPNDSLSLVYFDESGTPTLEDKATTPYFVITAVVFSRKRDARHVQGRFKFVAEQMGHRWPFEFKANDLSRQEHERVLRELGPIDFTWAAVCLVKDRLCGPGFTYPKTFYKYAAQLLVHSVLDYTCRAELYFDDYGGELFHSELATYLAGMATGLPEGRLGSIDQLSSRDSLIQMSDLLAGAVTRAQTGTYDILHLVEEKLIQLRAWPPSSG